MSYTVKQVAAVSGVSVRTLHFCHETGLLELQQIMCYPELGFEQISIQPLRELSANLKTPKL
jgi:hypothetical protein